MGDSGSQKRMIGGIIAVALLGVMLLNGELSLTGRDVPAALLAVEMLLAIAVLVLLWQAQRDRKAHAFGGYRLVERLGYGGMGEVWRAEHGLLARPAAIKLIRREAMANGSVAGEDVETAIKRFEREAQATAGLTSPHTIELYDFGAAKDGTFYIVMEILDGLDLESVVGRFGPLPPERVIYLMQQIADSLAEAHRKCLVHRDIKPANIYVTRRGLQCDFVKVLDFGLVKARCNIAPDDPKLTGGDFATGTPAYMAPEVVTGEREADPRSDLYALGAVGYWLLTGRLVFEGESALQVALAHVRSQPVPPSERTELAVPACLDRIILQLLDKDPDHRPQSAEALTRMLAGCQTRQTWTQERAARWWRTHLPDDRICGPTADHRAGNLNAATQP